MNKKIRWGIAGPGNIANKFAKAVMNVKDAELVAAASRNEERGRAFAENYNIPLVFKSYEDMANSDEIDAVYVAAAHPFHKSCGEICLNAKKHVLCEKPVCVNTKEAIALKECAEMNNVFLMEAMWTRFLPLICKLQEIVRSGEIGEVKGVKADFCYNFTSDDEHNIFKNKMAGGSLLDVGVYGLNFADLFLSKNPEITAVANIENATDRHTQVLLKYENGAIASISSATTLEKPADGYIYGTKGYIFVPDFFRATEAFVYMGGEEKHIVKPSIGAGFEEEIIEACSCINSGKTQSDIMPMTESIYILEQMDEVRRQIGLKYPMDEV